MAAYVRRKVIVTMADGGQRVELVRSDENEGLKSRQRPPAGGRRLHGNPIRFEPFAWT